MNNGTKNTSKTQRIYCRTVSKSFRETILRVYPRLHERKHYWPLLAYLLFPNQVVEGKTLLARTTLAELFGYSSIPPYFNTERLLKGFAEAMHIRITWSDYSKLERRARIVESLDWPKKILVGLKLERERLLWRQGRVYLISGKPFSKKKQYEFMRNEKEEASMNIAHTKETEILLRYMNSLPNNIFARLIELNGGKTLDTILKLPSDREHQWGIFSSIVDDYAQVYQPTNKSVRIFPVQERIVSLKSEVRKTLTTGYIEADLKSSQFAIAATLWNIPSVKKFLSEGGNLWEYLYQAGNSDKDEWKKILYSLMFGMHYTGVKALLSEIGVSYRDFINLPLIGDLMKARNKEMERIKSNGGATTCFGKFLSTEDFDVKSILAQCCQAKELEILFPIVELALETRNKKHGFTIVLWQHDGFTFKPNHTRDKQYWINKLKEVIHVSASSHGIMTQLICEEL